MKTKLLNRWFALRATFWFVPALFATGAVLLAAAALHLDARLNEAELSSEWLYPGSAEGARAVLIMLAGSMIGIAGVAFSITIVALSLASAHFGPRLLRNFLRDPGNQIALGVFVATFLYCVLVTRSVVESQPVPLVAMSLAVALSVLSVGVLIYFFHHVSTSIQATSVVAAVARDLERSIDRLCGSHGKERTPAEVPTTSDARTEAEEGDGDEVVATSSGYVQAIDYEGLLCIATERDAIFSVCHRAGDFITRGGALVRAFPAGRIAGADEAEIRQTFVVSDTRTEEQDLEYSVRQLVEVALRALSPGINDPFTAINCIDWLGAALSHLSALGLPPATRHDEAGALRLRLDALTFEGFADAALEQIRQAGASQVAVAIRMLDVLGTIAPQLAEPQEVRILMRHADEVLEAALAADPIANDRVAIADRHARTQRALDRALCHLGEAPPAHATSV